MVCAFYFRRYLFVLDSLWTNFDTTTSAMQFVERVEWIPQFNIYYSLGVDGLSMPLVLLTTFTQILVIASAWDVIKERVEQYMGAFMIMQGLMIGVFVALDGILFYVFWEALLIPMFIVIGKWGGPNRVYATIKFFLYTFFGSVFMLVAFLYMYFQSGSFSILDFHTMSLSHMAQILIFLAFLIASRSRCRCSRCILGCRMRTFRHQRQVPLC